MLLHKKETSTFKLFISLNIMVIFFAITLLFNLWLPETNSQRIGNIVLLLTILVSFFIYGKIKITTVRFGLFFFSIFLYLIWPGVFAIGVPLVPLLGLFLSTKKHDFQSFREIYIKKAKIVSIITFLIVYLILYISKLNFGGGTANLVSILALYVIAINMIFFRTAFASTVLISFFLSILFTPGPASYGETPTFGVPNTHQGNRSAVFLLLFLFSMKNIQYFCKVIIKKKYFVWFVFALIPLTILTLSLVSDFLNRGKMVDIFSDPRFQWFMPMLKLLLNEGLISFFNNGSDMLNDLGDGRRNPHNSFFYLLLEQYWLGLLKIFIYFYSIFIIPISAWFAIAGRASFDIFLLLGPQDIILIVLILEFYKFRYKHRHKIISPTNKAKNETSIQKN